MINIPINIDLVGLVDEFNLSEDQSIALGSSIIDGLMAEYTTRWEDLVNKELKQSRAEYKRGMYVERTGPLEVVFGLTDRESFLPLAIEEGKSPFDEKPGLLNSPKAKRKKDGGFYITVPFRHATPQAVAESGIFNSILPKDVYDLAKNSTKPLKRKDLPEQHQVLEKRKEIQVPGLKVPEYMHKSAKYEGLVKVSIPSSSKENRSGYFTFRRVSDTSDPNSWWNGGIEAHNLMDRALEAAQVDKVADMIIDAYLQNNI